MSSKPHAVCMPFPAQGHINGMLKLAKVLHCKGFHITFVNTEHNQRRILKSRGPAALQGLADFKFETIPDGLPPADNVDTPRDIQLLCVAIQNDCLIPFRQLVSRLNEMDPPVTCIISDTITSFTVQVAAELQIPDVFFNSASACGHMAFLHYDKLVQKGILPLKDFSNGYLNSPVADIPGLKNMRIRDLTKFSRAANPDGIFFNFVKHEGEQNFRATALVNNTFQDLEGHVLNAMSLILPPIYAIGPLSLLSRQMIQEKSPMELLSLNLWKEDPGCLKWLEGRHVGSVLYVNFGSYAIMTNQQLIELAWGLANSGYDFLWVIRPDLVRGDSAVLPLGFLSETSDRSFLASWCPQEEVLHHPAIGGFLTHCGWNSSIESICCGVPMICWPFFADQPTTCRYLCTEWGVGLEMDDEVTRENVEGLSRELMGGEKGKEIRKNVLKWKESAIRATQPGGSSFTNLGMLISKVILQKNKY